MSMLSAREKWNKVLFNPWKLPDNFPLSKQQVRRMRAYECVLTILNYSNPINHTGHNRIGTTSPRSIGGLGTGSSNISCATARFGGKWRYQYCPSLSFPMVCTNGRCTHATPRAKLASHFKLHFVTWTNSASHS